MKTTHILMAGVVVGLTAVVSFADTKDSWKLKMNLNDGTNKTLMLEGIDSIVLGNSEKPEVKPGDVDENGEPILMDVSYNHYYEWVWYHHNMTNNTYPVVERTRTFSDGTVLTDEFRDYGHPAYIHGGINANLADDSESVGESVGANFKYDEDRNMLPTVSTYTYQEYTIYPGKTSLFDKKDIINGQIPTEGERYIVNPGAVEIIETENELSYNITHSLGVDYLNDLYIWDNFDIENIYASYGQWNKYGSSKIYNSEDGNLNSTISGLPMGWYFQNTLHSALFQVGRNSDRDAPGLLWGSISFDDYDQYFTDELKLIDFLDLKANVKYEKPTLEKTVSDRGECYVFKCSANTIKCGIHQNMCITDTIYEIKYDAPMLRYLTPLNNYAGDFEDYFYRNEDKKSYTMISSLQPIVQIQGEGYSFEINDLGEEPTCTNHSLPFHKWEIIIKSDENLEENDRHGEFNLLDAYGNILQTVSLITEKRID